METVLKAIYEETQAVGVQYYDMTNTSPKVTYPYVTGELTQSLYDFEDGSNNGDLLLEAWTRGERFELVSLNEKIKQHFKDLIKEKDGKVIHFSYVGAIPQRTNDNTLKKLQINLDITWWEGE